MKKSCAHNVVWSVSLSPVALMLSALGGQIGTRVFGAADYQEVRYASLTSLPPDGSLEEFVDVAVLAPLAESICLAIVIKILSYTSLTRFTAPIAGLLFGILHWATAPQSFFSAFAMFWLFAVVFIRARESSFRCGLFSATLIHSFANSLIFLIKNVI